ncbi:supporter of activation of yellow protein-like [Stomoxys calcitrans]|uniref:supporter of activation of yellow protein-like n=2 Tax=Stomoxys calcitrans TaxID=35570 RepID=UPI0027E36943|nr:supporter of activation of yellow protein-like [Stomoxys calcitrans]
MYKRDFERFYSFTYTVIRPQFSLGPKNVGSPQQKLKFVVDTDIKSNKNTITLPVVDVADEFDLLNVDNVGGESSNSQEFCGFNDNADCTQNKEIGLDADANTKPELPRRHSDDMDIDETLRDQHEPKMFQNATNIHAQDSSNFITNEEMDLNGKASLKIGHIIDTVDLTSSAGSSPVHRFDYNDGEGEDNDVREKSPMVTNTIVPSTNILLECLQRETTVIQNTQQLTQQTQHNTALPPLQPKPMVATKSSVSLKYPQLAERLLANGSSVGCMDVGPSSAKKDSVENIIDSIEILDTPEGSPRGFIDDRHENDTIFNENLQTLNGLNVSEENRLLSLNNNSLNLKRPVSQECHVSETICTAMSEKTIETPSKLRKIQNESEQLNTKNNALQQYLPTGYQNHQRLRKQKHEHLLPIPMDEVTDAIQTNSNDSLDLQINIDSNENSTPIVKKRGRPKKSEINLTSENAKEEHTINSDNRQDCKARRVQLLRKRLAIDMVDAEQPVALITDIATSGGPEDNKSEQNIIETPKRERNLRTPLRTSRRSNTPINFQSELKTSKSKPLSSLSLENKKTSNDTGSENELNHFHESNSSISSVSFHSSSTIQNITNIANSVSHSMTSQIDLTISSSSSNSNGSTTNTITTVEATSRNDGPVFVIPDCSVNGANIGSNSHNSMLPPTTILSSSDPLPDMIFKPNDFSSIIATQQLRVSNFSTVYKPGSVASQEEETADDVSGADNSEDDSASSSSMPAIPGRSRGRVRGSRGRSIGRGQRSHGISRDSLSVKSIAMNRPRCIGALKHTPDPERIKELFSPSPQVFEEDTRMSADLSQTSLQQQSPSYSSQPDFFTNEESQSSIISNTSIIDPNSTASAQNSASAKKTTKKKKMEVCVAEDTDFTVASIAEYDWPPPKGCCPSKNRDTFMIQEQVAMYLGIKSFKRKYPDLPRRQVDMEERNWLQEKGLVSEKMCDLGITAVWASDILDIMYTDFYEKYEEYKDFVRQKHLREIEAKQKSLGLNVAGRGLQARERAMLSTSKWNSYFNRTRKDERLSFLDLQTLVINKPCPSTAPLSTIPNRPVAEAVALAIKTERISQPPTLLKPRIWEPSRPRDIYYPLSLVPGQFCEKYHDYSSDELRCMPLNTVVDPIVQMWSCKDCGNNSSDTDSAIESIDNKTEIDKSLPGRRHKKRRLRRTRQPGNMSADEFKVPLLPGAPVISTSSTDSCSSSDTSSSETDSESSCSSSSSDESSNGEESLATCEVCLRPHNRNLNNVPELFLQCYTCRRRVHPSCIEMPHRMSLRVRNYNWQCADCKCCVKCKRRHDQNKMLFCEQCDRGFHIYCLGIKTVPDGRWSCNRCSICMRCGATTPEGLSHMHQLINTAQGEHVKQTKQKKAKWVNEYRLDHLTKIKEHCSMLCIPCGKMKNSKRAQNVAHNNATTKATSPCSLSESSSNSFINYPPPSAISSQKLLPSPNATSNGELMHSSTVKESSGHAAPSTSIPTEDSYFSDNKDSERYSPVPSSFTSSIIAASNTQMTTTHNATGGPPPVVA